MKRQIRRTKLKNVVTSVERVTISSFNGISGNSSLGLA